MPEKFQVIPAKEVNLQKDGELVIKYRPYASVERWIKHRFSAPSGGAKLGFVIVIIVMFFIFGGPIKILELISSVLLSNALNPGNSSTATAVVEQTGPGIETILVPFLLAVGFLSSVAMFLRYLSHPTHVSLSSTGICTEWHHFNMSNGLMLPWQSVERIDLVWPEGKTSPQDAIIQFKDSRNLANAYPIKLKLGCIASADERYNLLKAIQLWAGNVPRDPQIQEMLTPAQDESYTELWLQALSAPPKRERLTPIAPGAVLLNGKYKVEGQLGVGGQGTAYLATCEADQSHVVLKEFILPVYVDVNVRRQALESMQHEAAMLKRLDNNRVVRLIEFFVEDHRGYLVLERIDGLSLRRIVEENGCMDETRVRELAAQMCSILEYLHNLSPPVVHRDFTPDNLILGKDGVLKLVDFNVAQQTESTATGTVVGKHAYLPPEQFRGRPVPQSDIYAMGATLNYLLLAEDPEPITCSHPMINRPEISTELDAIIAHATALDTKKRYGRVEELAQDLGSGAASGSVSGAASEPTRSDEVHTIDLRVRQHSE